RAQGFIGGADRPGQAPGGNERAGSMAARASAPRAGGVASARGRINQDTQYPARRRNPLRGVVGPGERKEREPRVTFLEDPGVRARGEVWGLAIGEDGGRDGESASLGSLEGALG